MQYALKIKAIRDFLAGIKRVNLKSSAFFYGFQISYHSNSCYTSQANFT